jgi:hypothetical protein
MYGLQVKRLVRIIGPLFGVKAYQQADTPIPDAVAPQSE